jgi:hypothetical protein
VVARLGAQDNFIERGVSMAEQIKGLLEVQDDVGTNTRISLDGNAADVRLGGSGQPGHLTLRDQGDHERIHMDGGTGELRVRNGAGKTMLQFSCSSAALWVGGTGQEGDVLVRNGDNKTTIHLDGQSGDIILSNADCAEEFDVSTLTEAAPGTVMVLGDHGQLEPCCCAYDARVAGVVSGAGDYKPGIVLDRQSGAPERPRVAIALVGKTFCKVDAGFGPVAIGDLLTTSITPGHAMKASERERATGAVIGKALRPVESGIALIPILVALQ